KGFTITKLVTECFRADKGREDKALYDTFKAIRDRLAWNVEVKHPVTPDEMLTSGTDDAKTSFLKARLDEALHELKVLFDGDCARAQALQGWTNVFHTELLTERLGCVGKARAASGPGILSSGLLKSRGSAVVGEPVREDGGGRYAYYFRPLCLVDS